MVLCHHHDVDWGSKTLISDMGLDNSLGHAGKVVTEQYSEVIVDNEGSFSPEYFVFCSPFFCDLT